MRGRLSVPTRLHRYPSYRASAGLSGSLSCPSVFLLSSPISRRCFSISPRYVSISPRYVSISPRYVSISPRYLSSRRCFSASHRCLSMSCRNLCISRRCFSTFHSFLSISRLLASAVSPPSAASGLARSRSVPGPPRRVLGPAPDARRRVPTIQRRAARNGPTARCAESRCADRCPPAVCDRRCRTDVGQMLCDRFAGMAKSGSDRWAHPCCCSELTLPVSPRRSLSVRLYVSHDLSPTRPASVLRSWCRLLIHVTVFGSRPIKYLALCARLLHSHMV